MEKPLPYVIAALLCEKVIIEKDETLTIIRLADRIQYQLQTTQGLPDEIAKNIKPIVNIQGLISLKSGPVTGDHIIKIIGEKPNGDRAELFNSAFKFLGKDQGQNVILNLGLVPTQDGLHWFDVLFDDEQLTRIPIVITAQAEPEQPKSQK